MSASVKGEITRQQIERYIEESVRNPPLPKELVTSPAFQAGFLSSMMASLLNGERDIERLRQEIVGAQQ